MAVRLVIEAEAPDPEVLERAVEALARGLIVAFPTDTLYGLAVDPRQASAVRRLFDVKGGGRDRAVPLVAADLVQVENQVGELGAAGRRLAGACWPGPLTLVIRAHASLVPELLGERATVAVRVPAHTVARALAATARHPLTATSANRSGAPAPSTAEEVERGLGSGVDLILDAGPTRGGAPSTIVDVSGAAPKLLRAGAVPWRRVLEFLK